MEKNPEAVSLGRKGGNATKSKLGIEHYSRIGKKGRKKQLTQKTK